MSITIVEDAACSDQKIYSQSIPHAQSATDIYVLPDQQTLSSTDQVMANMQHFLTHETLIMEVTR